MHLDQLNTVERLVVDLGVGAAAAGVLTFVSLAAWWAATYQTTATWTVLTLVVITAFGRLLTEVFFHGGS